jgi:integrin beta 3
MLEMFAAEVGKSKAEIAQLVARLKVLEERQPADFSSEQINTIHRVATDALGDALIVGRIASLDDVAAAIAKIPAGPPGQDGKDGKDGADGADGKSVTAADLSDIVDAAVADHVAALPDKPFVVAGYVDRDGDLYFTNSDGSAFKAGHVVGKDGKDAQPHEILEAIKAEVAKFPVPKDGKDGFALTDFNMRRTGQRSVTLSFESGDIKKEFTVTFATPLYQGVWHEGKYLEGDCATHEGSTWIALQDTSTRPGTTDSGWQLAIKRGRDGREGKQGPPGPAGKDGRDGRDLTQLGPDGKKW